MTFMKKKANITILIRCMYILYALDTVNRVSENVVLKESQAKKRVIFTKEILYVNLISWHKCRVLYFRIVFFWWHAACSRACFYVKRRDKTEWSRRLDTRGKQ